MSVHPLRREGETRAYKFQVRWREHGRNRSRNFDRKGDAEAFDFEIRRAAKLGPLALQQLTGRGGTLTEWVAERWAPEHAAQLAKKTRKSYADLWARRIEPLLGHVPLRDITVSLLREWQRQLLAAGVTPDGVDRTRTVLSSILRHAAESEAIAGNPLGLVRPPKPDHRDEIQPLTVTQVELIRRHLPPRDALMVSLLAYSGVRPGELRGLRWQDVRERTLLVQRAIDPDSEVKSVKGTRRARTVRLLDALRDDLAAYRQGAPDRQYIISRAGEGAWTESMWDNWRTDRWRPAARRAGLEHVPRPYDLRHSFASLLLAEGKTVHDVARQLGHSPTMTLRVYGHVIDEYAGLEHTQQLVADHEIARVRAELPDLIPGPRTVTRAELDELLGSILHARGPDAPPITSAELVEQLQAQHNIAVRGETVTYGMKRLTKRGDATQSIGSNHYHKPVLAWQRTPTFALSSQHPTEPHPRHP